MANQGNFQVPFWRLRKRMNKEYEKKGIIITVVFVSIIMMIVGIIMYMDKRYDYSRYEIEGANRFGVSFMTMNNPFFAVISDSIRTAAEANGDIVIVRDPALDAERQNTQIRDMLAEGIDVLFVTPVDYEAIIPVISEAKEKGVIIISVDTEISVTDLADCAVVSNNYLAGRQCGEYLMNEKESAKILILGHSKTKSGNDRISGFVDAIKGHEDYQIIDILDAEGQVEIAMPITNEVINAGKDFDTVFAINDLSALGAMAALKDSDKINDVAVLGVDGSPEAKAMIKEKLMLATSAQHPVRVGDYALEQAYKILRNESYEEKILVDVELITRENVESFGISNWQ